MSSIAPPESEGRAGPREWIGLAVLALPTILIALDLTVLYMAIPHLGADLNSTNTEVLWITDIYGFVIAGFLITMGTLGDRIGRRKLLLVGAVAFAAASVLAAYSTSSEMLIAARALLGLAGATLMPSTLALISNMFRDAKQRAMAIGIWLTSFSIGGVVGPAIGGALLEWFWWGSVFLMGVPVMVLLLITGPLLLPEYRDSSAGRLDLASVALSLGMILPVIYGIKEIAKDGVQLIPILAIVVGLAIGVLFVRRQRTLASPLFDLRLFKNRSFTGGLVAMWLGQLTLYAFGFYFAQFLQLIEGLSPLQAGVWFLPMGLATIVGAMLAPMLAAKFPPAMVIVAGLPIAAAGYAVLALLNVDSGLAFLISASILISIGINPLLSLSAGMIVSSAPPDKAGSASAVMETSGEFGAGLGIAIFGTIGTAIYSNQIAESMPDGVPAAVAETARDSFAGAFAAAGELSAAVGDQLIAVGRVAFLNGMNVVHGIAVVVMVIIGCLVMVTLRHVPPIGSEAPAEEAAPKSEEPDARPDTVGTTK
ncbi:MFS transporter [Microtetraspora sp. NBRC 13810]|uniref:MFS transporter n=1 Tax=Microtetraspora sp. NBRC 13810 TaxID=3030990 RepID=UPI0024A0CD92|nr:MFS transporter [Microtetraspora sp. NBRC 13810]GLW09415.1 MFS transporter [Microtetraspora sp. NBRC 13810]